MAGKLAANAVATFLSRHIASLTTRDAVSRSRKALPEDEPDVRVLERRRVGVGTHEQRCTTNPARILLLLLVGTTTARVFLVYFRLPAFV